MTLKRVSIAMTVGLGILASQGCMAEPMDESEIGSAEQAACANYTYAGTFAAVIVAMSQEIGELHPTKYLVKQSNMWGNGRDGVNLTQAAKDKCAARGVPNCPKLSLLLAYQDPGINGPGMVPTTLFAAEDYRSNMVSKLQDQINYENSRSMNGLCLPGAHTITEDFEENGQTWPKDAECGLEYRFTPNFGGGGGSFEVAREAESFNSYNQNGSSHSWSTNGGNMAFGPDWNYTFGSIQGSPNLSYQITFPAAGNYKVWVRGMGYNGGSDSVYVGINGSSNNALVDLPENGQAGWAAGDISVPSAGTHNVQLFGREDGTYVDKIVVNQSSTAPGGSGGATCNTPADLGLRIQQFSVPNVNFHADATAYMADPDPVPDPGSGGSGSGSAVCGAVPASGSDKPMIAYNADKEGDCCWSQYVQKTYKRYRTIYLLCS